MAEYTLQRDNVVRVTHDPQKAAKLQTQGYKVIKQDDGGKKGSGDGK